jgi:hypothetical protein
VKIELSKKDVFFLTGCMDIIVRTTKDPEVKGKMDRLVERFRKVYDETEDLEDCEVCGGEGFISHRLMDKTKDPPEETVWYIIPPHVQLWR